MKRFSHISLLLLSVLLLNSCSVVEGIFKAGMWTGILMVVAVIAAVIWLISKVLGRKR